MSRLWVDGDTLTERWLVPLLLVPAAVLSVAVRVAYAAHRRWVR